MFRCYTAIVALCSATTHCRLLWMAFTQWPYASTIVLQFVFHQGSFCVVDLQCVDIKRPVLLANGLNMQLECKKMNPPQLDPM